MKSEDIKKDISHFKSKWRAAIEKDPSQEIWTRIIGEVEVLERYYKQDQELIDQLSQALLDLTDTWNERRKG